MAVRKAEIMLPITPIIALTIVTTWSPVREDPIDANADTIDAKVAGIDTPAAEIMDAVNPRTAMKSAKARPIAVTTADRKSLKSVVKSVANRPSARKAMMSAGIRSVVARPIAV